MLREIPRWTMPTAARRCSLDAMLNVVVLHPNISHALTHRSALAAVKTALESQLHNNLEKRRDELVDRLAGARAGDGGTLCCCLLRNARRVCVCLCALACGRTAVPLSLPSRSDLFMLLQALCCLCILSFSLLFSHRRAGPVVEAVRVELDALREQLNTINRQVSERDARIAAVSKELRELREAVDAAKNDENEVQRQLQRCGGVHCCVASGFRFHFRRTV